MIFTVFKDTRPKPDARSPLLNSPTGLHALGDGEGIASPNPSKGAGETWLRVPNPVICEWGISLEPDHPGSFTASSCPVLVDPVAGGGFRLAGSFGHSPSYILNIMQKLHLVNGVPCSYCIIF